MTIYLNNEWMLVNYSSMKPTLLQKASNCIIIADQRTSNLILKFKARHIFNLLIYFKITKLCYNKILQKNKMITPLCRSSYKES